MHITGIFFFFVNFHTARGFIVCFCFSFSFFYRHIPFSLEHCSTYYTFLFILYQSFYFLSFLSFHSLVVPKALPLGEKSNGGKGLPSFHALVSESISFLGLVWFESTEGFAIVATWTSWETLLTFSWLRGILFISLHSINKSSCILVFTFLMVGRVLLAFITSRAPDMKSMEWREFWHLYFFSFSTWFLFPPFHFSPAGWGGTWMVGGITAPWSIAASGMLFCLFFSPLVNGCLFAGYIITLPSSLPLIRMNE